MDTEDQHLGLIKMTKIERLRNIISALESLLGWYEYEFERYNYDDDELDSEELLKLEAAVDAARAAKWDLTNG
ncbi:hypothetical protein LCGC14_0236120 [marine sediment metagenome]|uniref:Uncharacterized protein n=1 Tax=marine sediment metagenome TaxID=412755 RepID=A0A0F9WTZ1_9ZZZZ